MTPKIVQQKFGSFVSIVKRIDNDKQSNNTAEYAMTFLISTYFLFMNNNYTWYSRLAFVHSLIV